jgi:starch synthase
VVSRLTPQKGVHLIKHAAYKTLERGGQFVLLGSAPDPKVGRGGELVGEGHSVGVIYGSNWKTGLPVVVLTSAMWE